MKIQSDYLSELLALVQDGAADLSEEDKVKAIDHAVERFSQARPRTIVADVVGNSTSDYTPPSGWVDDWSAIKAIEYPVGNVPETYLESGDYKIYQSPTAKKIRLMTIKPTASETFRATITGLHSVTSGAGTINDGDFRAVCHLAGSYACRMLSARYAQLSEPTLQADSVAHSSKSQEYAARARELYKIYAQHIGADPEVPPAGASVTQDWDKDFGWGEDKLTHPRRWR